MPDPTLLPPPSDDPTVIARQALAAALLPPDQALARMEEGARRLLRLGERRQAALVLHRRAAVALRAAQDPAADLAAAARLLDGYDEERAIVLLDLGRLLRERKELPRATLVLRESERLARRAENHELVAAARHALSQVAEAAGDPAGARSFLHAAGQAMILEVESALLATLRDVGNLPADPWAERARAARDAAVEEELAALKRALGREGL